MIGTYVRVEDVVSSQVEVPAQEGKFMSVKSMTVRLGMFVCYSCCLSTRYR